MWIKALPLVGEIYSEYSNFYASSTPGRWSTVETFLCRCRGGRRVLRSRWRGWWVWCWGLGSKWCSCGWLIQSWGSIRYASSPSWVSPSRCACSSFYPSINKLCCSNVMRLHIQKCDKPAQTTSPYFFTAQNHTPATLAHSSINPNH